MRSLALLTATAAFTGVGTYAQTTNTLALDSSARPQAGIEVSNEKAWSFSASAYFYQLPNEPNYIQPSLTADHDWLHLEARYNYEAIETGSVWVGYNFSFGDTLSLDFTPMLGGVFGETMGIAPGYNGSLSWWKLELYSEGEYVFETKNSSDSFLYNWSELTLAPLNWFRFGLVTQRTRVFKSDREVQRGILVGFTYQRLDLAGYLFNPDVDKPTFVLAARLTF